MPEQRLARKDQALARSQLGICIASGTFHPDSGGPPTYLSTLGRELVGRGHRVRVVTYGDAPAPRRYPYPVVRIPRRSPVISRLPLFARAVGRAGRDSDLLFVNDYGLPATLANVVLRKPLVMKIVGDFAWEYAVRHRLIPPDEPLDRFRSRRYGPTVELVRALQARYTRRADLVIVPSRYVKSYVREWGVPADRIRVVRNAVADPTSNLQLGRGDARTELGLDPGGEIILTIARLTPWKGIDALIAAMPLVRQRRPAAGLLVVGDGPDRARLEALAAQIPDGAVRFLGEVPHDLVARCMRASDLLALCSGYEGLSHVLLEAMAAGLPVVASAVGGNVELLRDGENGLLVPYGDPPATAGALVRLLADRCLAARLAGSARRETAEWTVDRMVEETLAVFDEAIGRAGSG